MPKHPYIGQPDAQFWTKDPGLDDPAAFDPVVEAPFRIGRGTPVATAGSCFAQHVARRLAGEGYSHLIAEAAHPLFDEALAARFGYGLFSARYGNIYTARQLLQLLRRAYGEFAPRADAWPLGERFVDPFRPQLHPGGYGTAAELREDRAQHLAAVRAAVEGMEAFVFTLGLTEAWVDRRDGAVFPLAPGVAGGVWEPELTEFANFGVEETTADLSEALAFIRARNPGVKIILTVSPVPLNATMAPRHVAVSTAWSKAVLRVAAETVVSATPDCAYFPSYEIITSPQTRAAYYGPDGRTVLEAGVDHVMGVFFRHFGEGGGRRLPRLGRSKRAEVAAHHAAMAAAADVMCDEEAISNE